MSTPVVMPQMGESIAEGTIVRWIKKVGDTVDRDEPLFEISTDKVDAEIPSPAAGVLTNIAVQEGETVPVNSVVATIGDGANAGATPQQAKAPAPPASAPQADGASTTTEQPVQRNRRTAPAELESTESASARTKSQASYGETSPERPDGREGGPVEPEPVEPDE